MRKVVEVTGKLKIDYRSREWCKLPYPGHPKGCPNYGLKSHCPPQAPKIEDWLDLTKPHWFVVVDFNLKEFARQLRHKNPDLTDRQTRCVLYWQGKVRKMLKDDIAKFQYHHPGTVFTLLPEAMGIHVITTARRVGIPIKARPEDIIIKIALVGYPKNPVENKGPIDEWC